MPFANQILGGSNKLVRPEIVSPNFVHGVSGWRIGKDGTAEFHAIVLPNGQGVSVYFQGTAPSTTHTGDLWYNTSSGLQLSQWNGSSWIPYQIGNGALGTWAVDGLIASAGFHGLNMIPDPQFSNAALNNARFFDPATNTAPSFSGGAVQITAAPVQGAHVALMPSAIRPLWVNPGEQYFLSVTVTTSASCTVSIDVVCDNGSIVSASGTFSGTQTISGVVTIPGGAHFAFIKLSALSSSGSPTATFSNPVCQPATLNAPNISGGTITGGLISGGTLIISQGSGATFEQFEINGATGVTTWSKYSSPTVIIRKILADGTDLTYADPGSGHPQGALIASTSKSSGSDGLGNTYQAGICQYQGGYAAGTAGGFLTEMFTAGIQMQVLGAFAPASINSHSGQKGTLAISSGQANLGNDIDAGMFFTSAANAGRATIDVTPLSAPSGFPVDFQIDAGALAIGQAPDPAANGVGFFLSSEPNSSSCTPKVVNGNGFKGYVTLSQTDHSILTVTGTGITAITTHYAIPLSAFGPVNDAQVGTLYRIKAYGTGQQGSTQQNLFIDGNNGNPLLQMVGTVIPASSFFSWEAECEMRVTATGVSGLVDNKIKFSWQENAIGRTTNSDSGVQVHNATAFNTTIAQTIQIRMNWASATGGPTITCYGSSFERLGP